MTYIIVSLVASSVMFGLYLLGRWLDRREDEKWPNRHDPMGGV
jgi:hypothetical protein